MLAAMAGRVNRSQQDVIAYLQTENRVLREQLGGRHSGPDYRPAALPDDREALRSVY